MDQISVKDRFPNFEVYILFYTNEGGIYFGEYNCRNERFYFSLSNTNVSDWEDDEVNTQTCGFISSDIDWDINEQDKVTHWMEFPNIKPPAGE